MSPAASPVVVDLPTPVGAARVHLLRPRGSRGVLLLGHGAGPSITTVDLTAATEAASRIAGRAATLPPATSQGCSTSATAHPAATAASVAAVRSTVVMLGPAP